MPISALRAFLKLESSGGLMLIGAAAVALVMANSPLAWLYNALHDMPVVVAIGKLEIAKPFVLWVNDGLMAIFFFLIGLEIKREVMEGELSDRDQVLLPALAAFGGFVVPAGVYAWFNWNDPVALGGWAIPAATDIAFALAILAILGDRVPVALKIFLTSLAIFDDLGAIIVIAIFYTSNLSLVSLALAFVGIAMLIVLNVRNVGRVGAYTVLGIFIWVCVLKSGVHATLAGVVTALAIPLNHPDEAYEGSPLRHLEHALHGWVAFLILPLFAFINAGVSFAGMSLDSLLEGVPLGIALGLFVGKQAGVFGVSATAIGLGWTRLPAGASWAAMYGVSLLTGIGFTMSLFIGGLAFEGAGPAYDAATRAGVLIGSVVAAVSGYFVLRFALPKQVSE